MKILITGINGFVGRYLARELIASGQSVWGIDTRSDAANVVTADITDRITLLSKIKEISPDFIFHLAAVADVNRNDTSLMYDINVGGTLNVLNACINMKRLPRLIFISSAQVYGNVAVEKHPIDESMPVNPVNHYGAGKASGEIMVRAFSAEYGLEFVIFRPFNHTGPGQSDRFVVPKIVNAFKNKDATIELGNVSTIRDFTDVRDVVKAYADMVEHFQVNKIFNIASGKGICIADVVDIMEKVSGNKIVVEKRELLIRKNEILSVIGNANKLALAIGWRNVIEFERTLRDMYMETFIE